VLESNTFAFSPGNVKLKRETDSLAFNTATAFRNDSCDPWAETRSVVRISLYRSSAGDRQIRSDAPPASPRVRPSWSMTQSSA